MCYGLDDRGLITGSDTRFFSTPQRPDGLCGPANLSSGYRGALSPLVNRPESEADHSSSYSENSGAISPLIHINQSIITHS
jgi:hypothetical protein